MGNLMVASIHAELGYFSCLSNVRVKRDVKIVSQNGFQNGIASAYFPTYLRNLSEGLVDPLSFILVLSFYIYHTILKEDHQQLMTI